VDPLRVNSRLVIPPGELTATFACAGGPGGQNVNKVASKVVLRFDVAASECLGETRRARLLDRLAGRITRDGELVIHGSRYREQARNLEDARERLAGLLRGALLTSKVRRATRPTAGSKRRRLDAKRRKGARKRDRRSENDD